MNKKLHSTLVLLSQRLRVCLCCAVFGHPGSVTCPPGSPLGHGLTQEAAADLGLDPGTAVGASLIDAHAGGLGNTSQTCAEKPTDILFYGSLGDFAGCMLL